MRFTVILLLFVSSLWASDLQELMKEKKWTQAKAVAIEALKENPGDFALNMTAGICALNQKNYNEAIIYLSKASEIKGEPMTYFLLGIIFEETGNFPRAKESFQKSLNLKPSEELVEKIKKHLALIEVKEEQEK